jgi:Ca2+-binding EF-hand superfamily protein
MSYTDQQLRDAVDAVFSKYDKDNSQSLDQNEVYSLICDAMKHMNAGNPPSKQQVDAFVKEADKSGDGKIQKQELYGIFRKALPQ